MKHLKAFENFLNEGRVKKFKPADEIELRQWLVKEIGIKPYHIENHVFMNTKGESRKNEILAMWHNKKDRTDLKKWILSVVVPADKKLSSYL